MTFLFIITLLISPFLELEKENERLQWKHAERLTEYRHLVRRYEMIIFRQHLNEMNLVNQIRFTIEGRNDE